MRQLKITQSITARDSSLNYYLREVSQESLINLDEEKMIYQANIEKWENLHDN